jgi:short-subunit dehydrogenase
VKPAFADRYGPWALVAGASEGLGAAFARSLARRGLRLLLVARRSQPLAELAAGLPTETVTVAADLATADGLSLVLAAAADREIGLVVANAAYSPIGSFLDRELADAQRALDLNCRAPVTLAHQLLPPMVARGRGGFVMMSSLSSLQGSPGISTYAASKAFDAVLAEGLWAELRGTGVDVVTCLAGAIATPGLAAAAATKSPPGTVAPEVVAEAALSGLGRGPRVVAGGLMKLSAALVSRLPRRVAISMIARASRDLS